MNEEEYVQTQVQLTILAQLVQSLDLTAFIAAIDRADIYGPIIDPTLWRAGHDKMAKIRRMAVALRKFQETAQEDAPHA